MRYYVLTEQKVRKIESDEPYDIVREMNTVEGENSIFFSEAEAAACSYLNKLIEKYMLFS